MRERCQGQCKVPSSHDLIPEVTVHPVYGMRFYLHDAYRCVHAAELRMTRLRKNLARRL
jgi:hypothetical protein